jgi:capsular polysaccharide biosynthesis protein
MQLELRDYLNVLLKRWWLILLVAVSAAAGGYVASSLQPDKYQAATRLLVEPSRPDNGLIEFAKKNIGSYPVRLQSQDFLSRALAETDLGADPAAVLGALKVQAVPDTLTLNLTLDDADPRRAADILNAVSFAFAEMMNGEAVNSTSADKLFLRQPDLAQPPGQPYEPRPRLTAAAAGVLGLVLGLVLAFALEFLDDTLKTTDDIQRVLGVTTIGLIPTHK